LFSNKKLKNCESSVPQFFYHHLHHVLYLTRLEKAGAKTENPQRLGVNPNDAYSWSRIRMGGWAVAQSPIMGTTITLSRLKRRGYEPLLDYYFKVCPHYQSKQEIFPNV